MTKTVKSASDRNFAAAQRYNRDPERFAETHDPEALARQVARAAKTASKDPDSDHEDGGQDKS